MKHLATIVPLLFALNVGVAHADLYVELGAESGGDDIIGTNTGDEISAGGGIKLAIGVQSPVNEENSASLRLTVGYLFDSIDADNGDADIETMTFDAMYLFNSGRHTFGAGVTLHLSPEYSDKIAGLEPLTLEFDDTLGVVFQYGYQLTPGFEIGARITDIDYEVGNNSIDAGSFGIYLSNGF